MMPGRFSTPARRPAFLIAAVQKGSQARAAMAIQHADSFRPVKAMRREGKQVRAQSLDIHRQPAHGGFGIDVERDALFVGDGGDLPDRFQRADLVIDQMDGD